MATEEHLSAHCFDHLTDGGFLLVSICSLFHAFPSSHARLDLFQLIEQLDRTSGGHDPILCLALDLYAPGPRDASLAASLLPDVSDSLPIFNLALNAGPAALTGLLTLGPACEMTFDLPTSETHAIRAVICPGGVRRGGTAEAACSGRSPPIRCRQSARICAKLTAWRTSCRRRAGRRRR
jgi:hypothetical protein